MTTSKNMFTNVYKADCFSKYNIVKYPYSKKKKKHFIHIPEPSVDKYYLPTTSESSIARKYTRVQYLVSPLFFIEKHQQKEATQYQQIPSTHIYSGMIFVRSHNIRFYV